MIPFIFGTSQSSNQLIQPMHSFYGKRIIAFSAGHKLSTRMNIKRLDSYSITNKYSFSISNGRCTNTLNPNPTYHSSLTHDLTLYSNIFWADDFCFRVIKNKRTFPIREGFRVFFWDFWVYLFGLPFRFSYKDSLFRFNFNRRRRGFGSIAKFRKNQWRGFDFKISRPKPTFSLIYARSLCLIWVTMKITSFGMDGVENWGDMNNEEDY